MPSADGARLLSDYCKEPIDLPLEFGVLKALAEHLQWPSRHGNHAVGLPGHCAGLERFLENQILPMRVHGAMGYCRQCLATRPRIFNLASHPECRV